MNLSARAPRPTELQRRQMPFRDVELRSIPDGTGGETLTFSGYACVTEIGYEMQDWLGPFTEVVRSGAFTKTLSEGADVPFLINHGGMTLARTKSGTLQLAEDTTGLHTEARLDPANSDVRDLQSAMDRKDMDEMSFAFWVTRQQWSPDYDQRDILEVNLNKGDVSVVNYGANPNTAGATMNSRDLAAHLERLSPDERREVFDRLAAEFEQPAVVLDTRAQMTAWIRQCFGEIREGKQLSTATMARLQEVLDLVAAADVAVDEAQVVLSDVMDVPNPDDPDGDEDPDGAAADDAPSDGGGSGGSGGSEAKTYDVDFYATRLRLLALQ